MTPLRYYRGQLVKTWFDTGALGPAILYGIVVAAGPRRLTVRWESGAINAIRQDEAGAVSLVTWAERALAQEAVSLFSTERQVPA